MAKPNKVFLIRHGQSEGNVDVTRYYEKPDYAIELTDLGREQAREAGKKLGEASDVLDFWVSPYFRTRQTAEEITKGFKKGFLNHIPRLLESPLLREQEWCGALAVNDGRDLAQEQVDYGRFFYRFPGGESGADCLVRAEIFWNKLFENSNDWHPVAIVSHGMMIRVLLMALLDLTVEEFELLKNPKNCEIISLTLDGDEYKLDAPLRKREKLRQKFIYNKK